MRQISGSWMLVPKIGLICVHQQTVLQVPAAMTLVLVLRHLLPTRLEPVLRVAIASAE